MSYGDGGFYFLQPVNNGYGAIALQTNPYGSIKEGKKVGRYRMLYQPKGSYTAAEKNADMKKMKDLRKRLYSDKKKAANRLTAHMKTEAHLPRAASTFSAGDGVTQAEATAARQEWINKKNRLTTWIKHIEAALAAMNRNIKAATGRPTVAAKSAYKGGIKKKTPRSREGRTWAPSGPVDPEYVSVLDAAGAEFTPSGEVDYETQALMASDEAAMRAVVEMPSDLDIQAESMGIPDMEPGFFEKYRTLLLVGALGVGAFTVYKIVR